MSHKPETLKRIVALLEKDYPQAVFRYLLDTKRFMDTRIVPDEITPATLDAAEEWGEKLPWVRRAVAA